MTVGVAPTAIDIVSPFGELFLRVPTAERPLIDFCKAQNIIRPGNLKRAANPALDKWTFAEGWQGAYNVRFLQRVFEANQQPVFSPPDGLVLVTEESKKFYNFVSRRPDMHDLHGTGKEPHERLRKLLAGKPKRTHEWLVLRPSPADMSTFLRLVPLDSFMSVPPMPPPVSFAAASEAAASAAASAPPSAAPPSTAPPSNDPPLPPPPAPPSWPPPSAATADPIEAAIAAVRCAITPP